MSNTPAPIPDFGETVPAAQSAAQDNPQGQAAEPAKAPGGPEAKQPEAQAPQGPPPMPKLQRGAPAKVAPPVGDEALLYGPSTRPNEAVGAGAQLYANKPQPPQHLGQYVPALRAAASDPDASPLLVNLSQLLAYHLGG